jgi:hypothetical protein
MNVPILAVEGEDDKRTMGKAIRPMKGDKFDEDEELGASDIVLF